MLYRKFGKTNENVSILGFGCMRLPLIPGGDQSQIDEESAIQLIRYAIDQGVNYIDTAYPYHGTGMANPGKSELLVAKALKDGYRQKVNIATKLPSWLVKTREDMDRLLNEQLSRLETESIDFYLVHGLNEHAWPNLKNAGIMEFLDEAIRDGRIKHAGFSFHDKLSIFKEIVDSYDWSFCLMQYNYLDEEFQAGKEGLEYAAEKGLGIAIMEPLRGGKLASHLPKEAIEVFEENSEIKSPAEWAFRWVWNHPKVSVVLSGMNSMEQVIENIKVASNAKGNALTPDQLDVINRVKKIFKDKIRVDCTSCGYCMPCPNGVNIPQNFTLYNNYQMFGEEDHYSWMSTEQRSSSCVECGQCEEHCPQGISIIEELKNVKAVFE